MATTDGSNLSADLYRPRKKAVSTPLYCMEMDVTTCSLALMQVKQSKDLSAWDKVTCRFECLAEHMSELWVLSHVGV